MIINKRNLKKKIFAKLGRSTGGGLGGKGRTKEQSLKLLKGRTTSCIFGVEKTDLSGSQSKAESASPGSI